MMHQGTLFSSALYCIMSFTFNSCHVANFVYMTDETEDPGEEDDEEEEGWKREGEGVRG